MSFIVVRKTEDGKFGILDTSDFVLEDCTVDFIKSIYEKIPIIGVTSKGIQVHKFNEDVLAQYIMTIGEVGSSGADLVIGKVKGAFKTFKSGEKISNTLVYKLHGCEIGSSQRDMCEWAVLKYLLSVQADGTVKYSND